VQEVSRCPQIQRVPQSEKVVALLRRSGKRQGTDGVQACPSAHCRFRSQATSPAQPPFRCGSHVCATDTTGTSGCRGKDDSLAVALVDVGHPLALTLRLSGRWPVGLAPTVMVPPSCLVGFGVVAEPAIDSLQHAAEFRLPSGGVTRGRRAAQTAELCRKAAKVWRDRDTHCRKA